MNKSNWNDRWEIGELEAHLLRWESDGARRVRGGLNQVLRRIEWLWDGPESRSWEALTVRHHRGCEMPGALKALSVNRWEDRETHSKGVVRHPAHLQGPFRREMHSTLHGNCDRTTEVKMATRSPRTPAERNLRDRINPGAKLRTRSLRLAERSRRAPLANDSFEQLLKVARFSAAGRGLKRRVEISDSLVVLDQHGQLHLSTAFLDIRRTPVAQELGNLRPAWL